MMNVGIYFQASTRFKDTEDIKRVISSFTGERDFEVNELSYEDGEFSGWYQIGLKNFSLTNEFHQAVKALALKVEKVPGINSVLLMNAAGESQMLHPLHRDLRMGKLLRPT
jgi:hypothetical protein